MGKVLVEYKVVELFEGEPPETFGCERLDHQPVVGEVLQLHWLDGRKAHQVVVKSIDGLTIRATSV